MEELKEFKTRLQKRNLQSTKKLCVIQEVVSAVFEVSIEDMTGKSRKREFVEPRFAAMFLIRREDIFSLKKIGSFFSGRDHSSVHHAIETSGNYAAFDKVYGDKVNFCTTEVDRILR